jgi:hypothetical protein
MRIEHHGEIEEQLTPGVDEIDHASDRPLAAKIRLAAPTWKMPISMTSCVLRTAGWIVVDL